MPVTQHPLHRSVRAALPRPALRQAQREQFQQDLVNGRATQTVPYYTHGERQRYYEPGGSVGQGYSGDYVTSGSTSYYTTTTYTYTYTYY